MESNPYYKICSRKNEDCDGRITWEHVFIYAGKQINEEWAIIPLCWRHHLGDLLDKRINEWISINRASAFDFARYPNKNWLQIRSYLNGKYGKRI